MRGGQHTAKARGARRPGGATLAFLQAISFAAGLVVGVTASHTANAVFSGSSPFVGIITGVLLGLWAGPTTYRIGTLIATRTAA